MTFTVVTKNGHIPGCVSATITPDGGFRFLGANGRGRKYRSGLYSGLVSVNLHKSWLAIVPDGTPTGALDMLTKQAI